MELGVHGIPRVKAEPAARAGHTGKPWAWALLQAGPHSTREMRDEKKAAGWANVGSERILGDGAAHQLGGGLVREILLLLER